MAIPNGLLMRGLLVLALAPLPPAAQTLVHEFVSANPEAEGKFGVSVSGVPDVNGDGRADLS